MIKTLRNIFAAASVLLVISCSNDDYLNVIPNESIAIASIDLTQNKQYCNDGDENTFMEILGIDDFSKCGIDISSKIFAFETSDGTIGLVAHVEDADAVTKQFENLHSKGKCSSPEQHRGNTFVMIGNSWLAGYSDEALIIIGPITTMQKNATEQRMIGMFSQDEENSFRNSKLFEKLDSIDAPVSLVAQISALPEQFSLPFSAGMPKDADLSQVILYAGMKREGNLTVIRGNTFSFNYKINNKLKENDKVFRPVTGDMLDNLPANCIGYMFMNARGEHLLKVMQQNRNVQPLLAGANTAVDIDKILRSINGNMLFSLQNLTGDFNFKARLAKKDFLSDVGYWKSSCPAGSRIIDNGKDSYIYIGKDMKYYFSVSSDNMFISSLQQGKEDTGMEKTPSFALPKDVRSKVVGSRFAMLFYTDRISNDAFAGIIRFLTGGATNILYIKE